jgi:starch synthase
LEKGGQRSDIVSRPLTKENYFGWLRERGVLGLKIVYVASEVAPFIKTGGLGDVAGSLPRALAKRGHEVSVFCPLYSAIGEETRERLTPVRNVTVRLGWRSQYCGIFSCVEDGVTFYFLDNEYYFARRQIYGEYDDAERFAFFSKAVLEILPDLELRPDIINCNDWQTALIPVYYNLMFSGMPFYSGIKTVFTIHNIQYQGQFGRDILEYVLGIDDAHFRSGFLDMDGGVNLMKAAILSANAVTTVSPTYAQEIQTAYYGHRLDSVLRANSYKLHGILNGIDVKAFDPATDPALFAHYSAEKPAGKLKNKLALLEQCQLTGDADTPVIGMVSRFADHKGFDLVQAVLDDILQDDVRMIVLGKGEWGYEQMFIDAKRRHPDKIAVNILFSADMASQIYAGADILLMPSKSEPCGLAQMIALRYGTIPIVRETGGLKDTVQAYVDYEGTGNGFTFASYNAHDMLYVIRQAVDVFRNDKKAWKMLVGRGMTGDYSWTRSADQYLEVYQSL